MIQQNDISVSYDRELENRTKVFFLLTRRNIHSLILLAFFKFFFLLAPNAAVAVCGDEEVSMWTKTIANLRKKIVKVLLNSETFAFPDALNFTYNIAARCSVMMDHQI